MELDKTTQNNHLSPTSMLLALVLMGNTVIQQKENRVGEDKN
jgi:hypothetical protein